MDIYDLNSTAKALESLIFAFEPVKEKVKQLDARINKLNDRIDKLDVKLNDHISR